MLNFLTTRLRLSFVMRAGRAAWLLTVLLSATACKEQAQPAATANPLGTWRGTVKTNAGEDVAFTLEVKSAGQSAAGLTQVTGTLINGDDRLASTEGVFEGQSLKLRYDFYDGVLLARLKGDEMQGTFVRQWQKQTLTRELQATRSATAPAVVGATADLTGAWVLKVGEGEQQRLWRAAFKTANGQATGTIIPVSGDWGQLSGTFTTDNTLTLNRFDGINARIFKAVLQPDGTLVGYLDLGLFDPERKVVAERINDKNKKLVASLPDPNTYTRMSNASEPFLFNFPDLNGKVVAWDDARFKNKVVVVSITGSWCPNCHEETPYLQELYARYQKQGLEVVALAFEYTGEVSRDLEQVRIFAQRHGVQYPMLLAGSTEDAPKKLPQLINFGAYPTTLFIGRGGLVKRIHAGFEGSATGERFTKLKSEIEALVKELLAAKE
ncbi:MAG: TlpA family protein disulfide reductase [Acidobacteria bacterium]|nr:TlpA family protein disulfide reductase [Acidobacteriota bacterium]MBI3425340.1 TlpA family protein disulfide reductase [Acidobacteriota bacterium]